MEKATQMVLEVSPFRIKTSGTTHDQVTSHDNVDGTNVLQQNEKLTKMTVTNKWMKMAAFYSVLIILFIIYMGFALAHDAQKARPLLITSICLAVGLFYVKHYEQFKTFRAVYLIAMAAFLTFLIIDTAGSRYRLVSFGGLCFYIAICAAFSTHPKQINWRPVIWGVILQFATGFLVLRCKIGFEVLKVVSDKIEHFLNYAQYGTRFVYGFLAAPPNICDMTPIFAFAVLQTLLYFGSVIALLYYFGVIQFVLRQLAWLVQITMGTTAAESLNAAGCIFLGMTEGPLMIKPYFPKMTRFELHTVFASGFACIAGSLFAAYISFGACSFYLISACVMSAPASISISKLLLPETEESKLKKTSDLYLPPSQERNVIEAISQGASCVIDIIAQILANLVVFVALLAFINGTIGWLGELVGLEVSFEKSLGYLFFPLAFIMGASDHPDWDARINETFVVAQLLGTKTVLNEFIAYKEMGVYVAKGALTGRAQMIATFSLCGFSNFASIGTQLGTIGAICPEKRSVVSEIILRALFAGSIACFTTACVAGVLVLDPIKCPSTYGTGQNCTRI